MPHSHAFRTIRPVSALRTLELYIPALFTQPPQADEPLPAALATWMARATPYKTECPSDEALLCAAFGMPLAQAVAHDLPTGALALLGDGGDPADGFWLHADPVHMLARRTDLVLVDATQFSLRADEAGALIDTLNEHFAEDRLKFVAPTATRWYLRLPDRADLRTVALDAAAGHSVDPLLPTGDDALAFNRRANEIQMLLHSHPVNTARAERGAPEINSVWCWGAGSLPSVSPTGCTWWTDDPLARGLVQHAGGVARPCPSDAATFLREATDGAHAIVLSPAGATDPASRRESLASAWLDPLIRATASGAIHEPRLITRVGQWAWVYTLSRGGLRKFWRRRPQLPLADSHA